MEEILVPTYMPSSRDHGDHKKTQVYPFLSPLYYLTHHSSPPFPFPFHHGPQPQPPSETRPEYTTTLLLQDLND